MFVSLILLLLILQIKDSEPFNIFIDPSYGVFTDKGQRSTRLTYFVFFKGRNLDLVWFCIFVFK